MPKELVFSEKFDERSPEDQITYLKKLAASSNEALDQMQKERNQLRAEVAQLKQSLENAESAFHIQKNIVSQSITESNALAQKDGERIRNLERKLSEHGIKDD